MPPNLLAVYALAFTAGCAACAGVYSFGEAVLARHPDLVDAYRRGRGKRPGHERLWDLALGILVEEGGPRFGNFRQRIAKDLRRAGRPLELTAEIFLARSILQGILVSVVAMVFFLVLLRQPFMVLSIGIGAIFAFGVQPSSLGSEADARVRKISRRLPYGIDLVVLVLRAGGNLREGLEMLAEKSASDPLAEEVAIALAEIRAGSPQGKALTAMAERIQLEELSALVAAIVRGEETGAPMAKTLEIQAELFRTQRIQRAEKLAAEAPVKMMFPNMIIMIAVLLIVLGPMLLALARSGLF